METKEQQSLRLFILPKNTSPESRICTLPSSATSRSIRYYFCPEKGIFEFTRVAAPKSACCSWLIGPQWNTRVAVAPSKDGKTVLNEAVDHDENCCSTNAKPLHQYTPPTSYGYVIQAPEVFIATPFDPLFLTLPTLYAKTSSTTNSQRGLFLSADDLMEDLCQGDSHFNTLWVKESTRKRIEKRMAVVCDMVDADDERMYRLNLNKLLIELVTKATRTVASGLPATMEARFVSKAFETPLLGLKREPSSIEHNSLEQMPVAESQSSFGTESQLSSSTTETTSSAVSATTDLTVPDQSQTSISEDIKNLLRLRTVLSFMMKSYLPANLSSALQTVLSTSDSPIDFKLLDERLAHVASMRAEALASRSLSDFSRKRNLYEDDEAAEARAEKKRKREEDEKKQKAGESRGVRDLKKVDVSGMKKMSDFFGKGKVVKKS
ncbi:MAG: hypothetical protein LQ351_003138 [Letrouitia transgressa]|nr:MAG: hypothetical protein LQ351_003138 [Letrouitia transgressa]